MPLRPHLCSSVVIMSPKLIQSKLNAITDSFPDVNNPGPNQWFDVWLFLNQVLDELRVHKTQTNILNTQL